MIAAVLVSLTLAGPAWATFPSTNEREGFGFNRFFETEDGQAVSNLFSVNPDGSGVFQVTAFGFDTFSEFSDHSPDGRTLAFQRFDFVSEEENPATQVWPPRRRHERPPAHRLRRNGRLRGRVGPQRLSPDGRTLAIDAVADGVPGIFLIPARAPQGQAARRIRRCAGRQRARRHGL